jgi:hypothetical protein
MQEEMKKIKKNQTWQLVDKGNQFEALQFRKSNCRYND